MPCIIPFVYFMLAISPIYNMPMSYSGSTHIHTHTHIHAPKHTATSPSDMSLRTMVNRAAQGQETLEEYDEDMEEIVTPL